MTVRKTLSEYIYDNLREGGWTGVSIEDGNVISPKGEILSFSSGQYTLRFYYFNLARREYSERTKYKEIIFPKDFDIRDSLFFKRNGNYQLSYERQFKMVINPLGKEVEKIKITAGNNVKRFYGTTLTLSKDVFLGTIKDAKSICKRKDAYAKSTENYLANIESTKYGGQTKKKTTTIEKGEFTFLVDRLNLATKKKKKDFEKYLDKNDIQSLEVLLDLLIKKAVLSEEFLSRLNDFFIKENLGNIIELGKQILDLKTTDLTGTQAIKIITSLGLAHVGQLESLWQKYFEKYLLYLIFSYKKIFPKIELKDISGDKKYPDFIGINHYNGLDVIEIKTHLKNILVWDNSHENFYFSPEMSKAIVQTMNYMDAITQKRFESNRDRSKITSFIEEENLFHPRGVIIISSDKKLTNKRGEDEKLKRDFTKLRNSLQNITIITFDEVISIAGEYIENIVMETDDGA